MAERGKDRRRSWIGRYSISTKEPVLPTTVEGEEQTYDTVPTSPVPSGSGSGGGILPFKRSNSGQSLVSLVSPRPGTPLTAKKRSNSSTELTQDEPHTQNALERTISSVSTQSTSATLVPKSPDVRGSFSKMSLGSMLSSLSLTRSSDRDEGERGRSQRKDKEKDSTRSSSYAGAHTDRDRSESRARSQSPFRLRRLRSRDPSPTVAALSQSDAESDAEVSRIRPRNAFSFSSQSDDESGEEMDDDSDSEDSWSEGEQQFDDITEQNTEANALIPANTAEQDIPDYLGEGVNVIMPPEPYFPSTLNGGQGRNPRRRKSTKPHDTMPLNTSRPTFQRDRCIISVTHGSPEKIHEQTGRPAKRYVLASDLSEESRYALEWGIGTVLRDGDELCVLYYVRCRTGVHMLIMNTVSS